jgi:predicted nucleic acid-binding protein
MKLLVDTSVWSLALRRKDASSLSPAEQKLKAELTQAIQDGRVAVIGLIRQELLSGIKEQAQFEKVKSALVPFLDEQIDTADHEHAARLYNECRSQGFEVGPVDMLICAVAIRRNWQVLSNDSGLNHCLAVARKFQKNEKKAADQEGRKSPGGTVLKG